MDFITAPLIVGIIAFCIYRLFELYVRRKERIMLIEKMSEGLPLPAVNPGVFLPIPSAPTRYMALKVGCLLAGLGLGLLVAFFVTMSALSSDFNLDHYSSRQLISSVYGASVLLFGGLGLIIAFLIEVKMTKDPLK